MIQEINGVHRSDLGHDTVLQKHTLVLMHLIIRALQYSIPLT